MTVLHVARFTAEREIPMILTPSLLVYGILQVVLIGQYSL